jgi:hypothetical protein
LILKIEDSCAKLRLDPNDQNLRSALSQLVQKASEFTDSVSVESSSSPRDQLMKAIEKQVRRIFSDFLICQRNGMTAIYQAADKRDTQSITSAVKELTTDMTEFSAKINELTNANAIDPSRNGALQKAAQEMTDLRADIVRNVKNTITNQFDSESKDEISKSFEKMKQIHEDVKMLTFAVVDSSDDHFVKAVIEAEVALTKLGQVARVAPGVGRMFVCWVELVLGSGRRC